MNTIQKLEKYFTGRTEKYLVSLLIRDQELCLDRVYSAYVSKDSATAFIAKLFGFDVVESAGNRKLRLIDNKKR